jgi:RHS repeat-associated protein
VVSVASAGRIGGKNERMKAGVVRLTGALLVAASILLLPSVSDPQSSGTAQLASGQSATLLPDGRWLVLGGEGPSGPLASASLWDPRTQTLTLLSSGLLQARAGHTATILPDGTVLVIGGVGVDGGVVNAAESFQPQTQTFEYLQSRAPDPRAYHSATVLTDGRVLFVGGVGGDGIPQSSAELWNPQSGTAEVVPTARVTQRIGHSATLQSDGSVLISGGVDGNGTSIATAEVFDGASHRFEVVMNPPTPSSTTAAPRLAESAPFDGARDVPISGLLALRFSTPLRVETVTAQTMTLAGPQGSEPVIVTPVEGGLLAFVLPHAPLLPGATYTLSLDGLADGRGLSLGFTAIHFTTAGTVSTAGADTGTAPSGVGASAEQATTTGEERSARSDTEEDEWEWRGERRNGLPYSSWQASPPLQALAGVTALAGQVLRLNGEPLGDVTLQMERDSGGGLSQARTDDTGRFLLLDVRAGHRKLLIDGRSASLPGRTYGVFEVGVEIVPGTTTALSYTVWMPRIDTVHAEAVPSYTTTEVMVTTPRIPGLELHIAAHSGIRDHEGRVAREISITPIPQDRPPFPLPRDVETPAYFTIQPGAGYVYGSGGGARLVYPNRQRKLPGTRFGFWHYDPEERGWHVYGQGTVTEDGRQIVPDPKVAIYAFTGAMVSPPRLANFPLGGGPSPVGQLARAGDPVDLATGLFVMQKTDLVLPDLIPVVLTRTYVPGDTISRAFGLGSTHPYDIFLVGDVNPYTYVDLILPDGVRIHYARNLGGTGFQDAVYEHTATPTRYFKSRIAWNAGRGGWDLTLKDGTVYEFPDAAGATRPMQAALTGMRDRYGNALGLARDGNRNLTRITTPSGRWVEFTIDAAHRITQARDNIGRTVSYAYDATGRLSTVTDPASGVTAYTYDASNRMATLTDARGITYLTNEYDGTGKVVRQTQPGGIAYQFAYTLGAGGVVTQTEVTDPRGTLRRVTFNDAKAPLVDTGALGAAEQQARSYEWQAGTNLLQAVVDPLGRRTAYTYDPMGNLTTVARMAGTGEAIPTTLTYEPAFHQVASITDPLNHTTTFAYDTAGNVVTITDPLNHQTILTYTAQGQPQTVTTPAGPTQLAYDVGDLISITDPLGRTTRQFMDNAGRLAVVTDPRGNQTRYEYDSLNRLTKIIDPLGGQTQFGYDPNGNLLALTDARNNVTSYTYDSMDRVATRRDPLNRVDTYGYDLAGNVTQITDRRGKVTAFGYDGLDRKTFAGFGKTGPSTYESTIGYGYDGGNRLRTVADSLNGTIALTYDNLDRLTQEVSLQGTVSYGYDAASRRSTMTVLGQPGVTYAWDSADRLTQIARGAATVGFLYDSADRRTKLTLPNGVTVDYGWDQGSQLTGLTYKKGAATLGTLTYTYDAAGSRTQVGGSWARTGLPDAVSAASYNAANHQLELGERTMTYDLAGNLATLQEPPGATTFAWDARGQLTSMATPDGQAAFQYDGLGRRRSKTIFGTQTGFLYDGLTPVQELSGATVVANPLTGLGVDEYFARTTAAGTRTLLADALGSTMALTDDAGMVQVEYAYEPFGSTTETGSDPTPFQYTGRENDNTGLYYYRARYYHTGLQRFISEDPIRFEGGDVNLYAYVSNSPLEFTDPSGTVLMLPVSAECRSDRAVGSQPEMSGRKRGVLNAIANTARRLAHAIVRTLDCDPTLDLMPGVGIAKGPLKARSLFKSADALRRSNKQARDVAKAIPLNAKETQELHRLISGQEMTFKEILDFAKEWFKK